MIDAYALMAAGMAGGIICCATCSVGIYYDRRKNYTRASKYFAVTQALALPFAAALGLGLVLQALANISTQLEAMK